MRTQPNKSDAEIFTKSTSDKMNKETLSNTVLLNTPLNASIYTVSSTSPTISRIIMPLRMTWKPKEDISTYELAMCLPYLLRHNPVMPSEVNVNEPHMRHFEIHDPNVNDIPTQQ